MNKNLLYMYALILTLSFLACSPKEKIEPVSFQASALDNQGISAVAFDNDGKYMITGAQDGTISFWDIFSGKQLTTFKNSGNGINAAALYADKAALSDIAGTIYVNNLTTGEILFKVDSAQSKALRYEDDGKKILSLSRDGSLKYFDSSNGDLLESESGGIEDFGTASFGSEDILYSKGGDIILVRRNFENKNFAGRNKNIETLALSIDGSCAATAEDGGLITLWDTANDVEIQKIQSPEKELSLAIYGDMLLSGSEHGVTRLYSIETGAEILSCIGFDTEDGSEWISITPAGFFNSSANGSDLFSIKVGDKNYFLSQFSEALFNPEELKRRVTTRSDAEEINFINDLASDKNSPPQLKITSAVLNEDGTKATVKAKVNVYGGGSGVLAVTNNRAFQRAHVIEGLIERSYKEHGLKCYDIVFNVLLKPGNNKIGLSAFNQKNKVKSQEQFVNVVSAIKTADIDKNIKPVLHVLLAAVTDYENPKVPNLTYTRADAEALGTLFAKQVDGALYSEVVIHKLYDTNVTREKFIKAFEDIENAVSPLGLDSFVFYFSGHGDVDSDGDFFFVPYDYNGNKNDKQVNIGKLDIIDGILRVPAKNALVLLDTCHSGAVIETNSAFGLMLKQMKQKAVLVAAADNQRAFEVADLGHGVFADALLTNFTRDDATVDTRYINVNFVLDQVAEDVPKKLLQIQNENFVGRGLSDEADIIQEPVKMKSEIDFSIIDCFLEPGTLKISAKTPGTVFIEGQEDNKTIESPNGTVAWQLKEGSYNVTVAYNRNQFEERTIDVRNRETIEEKFLYEEGLDIGKIIANGLNAYKRQEYDRAIAAFNEAIRIDPKNADVFLYRGDAWDEKGNYKQAISDYGEALQLKASNAVAYNHRGSVYIKMRQYKSAIDDLNQALKIKADYDGALENRANAYYSQGEYDMAIADCTKAVSINSSSSSAYYNRGLAYFAKQNTAQAISDFSAAIKNNPRYAAAYYNRGNIYAETNENEKAISDYNDAVKYFPRYADAYNNRGKVYLSIRNYTKAVEDFETAVTINPNHPQAKTNLQRARTAKLNG